MPEVKVTDLDNDVSSDDEIVDSDSLNLSVYDLAEPFFSGDWTSDPVSFVDTFREVWEGMSTLRAKIDAAIWDAQDNGQMLNVESVRTRRSADAKTPGKKAEPKSLRDQLLKGKSVKGQAKG